MPASDEIRRQVGNGLAVMGLAPRCVSSADKTVLVLLAQDLRMIEAQ